MSKKTGAANLSAYKRRRYAELKNDIEMYEKEKEKERLRYIKKKEKGQVIPIAQKSPRDQRLQRKKWREASKKYRENKRRLQSHIKLPDTVLIETPNIEEGTSNKDTSQTSLSIDIDPLNLPTTLTSKKIRHIRYIEQKRRKRLLTLIQDLKKENMDLKNKLREITVNNVQKPQGKIDKHAKIKVKNILKSRVTRSGQRLLILIKKFFEQDSNSVIVSGKKQYITRNKIQKQKRRLILPLKQLHKKFISEHGIPVSYSFFCKHRPFWVLFPKKELRETNACVVHTNMDLVVQCLQKADIIKEKNFEQVLESLCCSQYNDNCLKRQCESCKDNVLCYKEFFNDQSLTLYQWVRRKETIKTKKGVKTQYVTVKKATDVTPLQAIKVLNDQLPQFYKHSYNINVQYNTTKRKKELLTVNEAYIHIDFSENFGLKYGKEVQSFHFGSNRKEISLHTGIIYTFDFHRSTIRPTCACTVSQCLRHDASAIWAHLLPMIKLAAEINPFIDTIHFQSDSPSSQYRNKHIFYIISVLHKDFPQLKEITWNYSEAGHGKGAPDGIGAVIKRTADNLVTFGEDISTFSQFIDIVKQNVENIAIMIVDENEVLAKEAILPKNLIPFQGTLNVHQVLWKKNSSNLVFRNASCFDCKYICIHGKHIGFSKVLNYCETEEERPGPSSQFPSNPYVAPLIRTYKSRNILTNITNASENINAISSTAKNIVIL